MAKVTKFDIAKILAGQSSCPFYQLPSRWNGHERQSWFCGAADSFLSQKLSNLSRFRLRVLSYRDLSVALSRGEKNVKAVSDETLICLICLKPNLVRNMLYMR